jgi:hypothetical protein
VDQSAGLVTVFLQGDDSVYNVLLLFIQAFFAAAL